MTACAAARTPFRATAIPLPLKLPLHLTSHSMNIHFHIGPDGDGSAARPFDGSLSQHFDLHLRHLAESGGAHHLHLGPGLYLTRGQRHVPRESVSSPGSTNAEPADHLGWEMLPGWKISGAGAEATILRLECWPGPRPAR